MWLVGVGVVTFRPGYLLVVEPKRSMHLGVAMEFLPGDGDDRRERLRIRTMFGGCGFGQMPSIRNSAVSP